MKIASILLVFSCASIAAMGGDWGKAPVDKVPYIEECQDLGAEVGVGYHSDYIYKGYLFGGDTVSTRVGYTFEGLSTRIHLGIAYANVVSENTFPNVANDDLALSVRGDLPSVAGIDAALSFTYHSYPEAPDHIFWPSGHGEVGLHLSKDLSLAILKFDLAYNTNLPNAWNGTLPTLGNQESGAWYWDLGAERQFSVQGLDLILSGGVAYADNYWGLAPGAQSGGRSSGWNHYYLKASLPVSLNCRTTIEPYIGYCGAPDGWLMDGAPDWANRQAQSDILHGGVNLSVSF
ncbi:MAG: hypothetical protein KDN18_12420 [Verrucomicrobiae bacterium]|nr:hypothetical protein [Verrucomicrobiae bacterium]